jgi:hypothetical protein
MTVGFMNSTQNYFLFVFCPPLCSLNLPAYFYSCHSTMCFSQFGLLELLTEFEKCYCPDHLETTEQCFSNIFACRCLVALKK